MRRAHTSLKTAEPFNRLFPVDRVVAARITDDMRRNGFREAFPLIEWKETGILLDGHTRRICAMEAGIKHVEVAQVSFPNEFEALEFAIRCQSCRRNLTDAELVRCVRELDKRRDRGGDHTSDEGKATAQGCAIARSSAETAELVGRGSRTVEKARTVLDHAEPELVEKVESGELSVNAAYNATQDARRARGDLPPKKSKPEPQEPTRPAEDPATLFADTPELTADEIAANRFRAIHDEDQQARVFKLLYRAWARPTVDDVLSDLKRVAGEES